MTDAAMKDAFVSMDMDDNKNIFNSYQAEVDRHVSFLSAFEDEVMGTEHAFLGVGHECDKDLVGGHLGFGTYDLQKCFSVGNVSSALEYDEIIYGDAVGPTVDVGEEAEREFFDGMLKGTDDRMLHEHKLLPCTSNVHCPDIKPVGGHPDSTYGSAGESFLKEKMKLENESQGLSGPDFEAEMSGLSSEKIFTESSDDKNSVLFDQMTVQELQEAFRIKFGRETRVRDDCWLKQRLLSGLQNNSELEEHLKPVQCHIASNESGAAKAPSCTSILDGGSLIEEKPKGIGSNSVITLCSEVTETGTSPRDKGDGGGPLIIGKRLHRPPRRYIEESLEPKSRSITRRCRTYHKASKVEPLGVKPPKQQPPKQLSHKGNGQVLSLHEEEHFNGDCIQVPFGLPVEEEQVKETPSSLRLSVIACHDSDNCLSNQSTISNERSDAECLSISAKLLEIVPKMDREVRTNLQKGKRRRKHHMPWTQSEVMKLIEGISHLGVGRWSKIKKLLFSSSKHRTSVDLKDKWRNLVKASSTQLRKKRKGLHGRKQLTHQAPEHVLRQVRELASLYS